VGEVEKPDPVRPSRVSGVGSAEGASRHPPTLMGLTRPFEAFTDLRSRYSVHGSRLVVRRPRGLSHIRQPTPERRRLPWTSVPLQGTTGPTPPGPREAPATLVGFFAPTATSAREVHVPGASSPGLFRLQGLHPPDGFLPPEPAGPRDRRRSWGSPCRAFPLRGAVRLSAPWPSCCFRHRVLML
jgi:hypothetical protein